MVKNFSKTIVKIVFVVFLGLSFIGEASAVCYKRTVIPPGDYTYVTSCTSGGSSQGEIKCEEVEDSYCGIDTDTDDEDDTDENFAEDIGTLEPGTDTVSCGTITDIPSSIPTTVHIIYMVIQLFVPLALIIFGMIDMTKAVMGQKEDEIKKGQQTLIKRIIAAAVVFFVFSVVKLVISFVSDSSDVTACLNCFIDNNCAASVPEEEPEE